MCNDLFYALCTEPSGSTLSGLKNTEAAGGGGGATTTQPQPAGAGGGYRCRVCIVEPVTPKVGEKSICLYQAQNSEVVPFNLKADDKNVYATCCNKMI